MKTLFLGLMLVMGVVGTQAVWASNLQEDREAADALLEAGEEKKAFKAYRTLARDGDHDSQYLLSTMYATGTGTKKDMADAYGWSVLAAQVELDKLQAHSEQLLAAAPDKKAAEKTARKLMTKYGNEALQEKADRLIARGNGRRNGSCTGSRLSCGQGSSVGAVGLQTVGGAGAPPVADGGN